MRPAASGGKSDPASGRGGGLVCPGVRGAGGPAAGGGARREERGGSAGREEAGLGAAGRTRASAAGGTRRSCPPRPGFGWRRPARRQKGLERKRLLREEPCTGTRRPRV